jgi:hypothetical protein
MTGKCDCYQLQYPMTIETASGERKGKKGDWLVVDKQTSIMAIHSDAEFQQLYAEPVDK